MHNHTVAAAHCQTPMPAVVDWRLAARYSPALLAGGHTSIPDDAYRCYARLGVTTAEWTLIGHICSYRWSTADPFPSDGALAARMGVSIRSIQSYTSSLVRKGLLHIITRHSPNGRQDTNAYDLSPFFAAVEGLARRDREPAMSSGTGLSLCVDGDADTCGGRVKDSSPSIKDEEDTIEKERFDSRPPSPISCVKPITTSTAPHPAPLAPHSARLVRKEGQPLAPAPAAPVPTTKPAAPEAEALAARVRAIGQALGDEAPASSVTHARALYDGTGEPFPCFLALLDEAARRTQARQDRITRLQRIGDRPNAMPYLFAVLTDLLDSAPPRTRTVESRRRRPGQRRQQEEYRTPTNAFDPTITLAPITESNPTWRAVLGELAGVLTVENFNRWFAPTRALDDMPDQDADLLHIAVPEPFHKTWLEHKLAAKVTTALARAGYPRMQVCYVVQTSA